MKAVYISLCFLVSISSFSFGQSKRKLSKVQEALYSEATYKRLKSNKDNLEKASAENGGAFYEFLVFVAKNPTCIEAELFASLESEYNDVVDEYNGLIDIIISEIDGINRIRDIKNIDLSEFNSNAESVFKKVTTFHQRLDAALKDGAKRCERQAIDPALTAFLVDIGVNVIEYFSQNKLEKFKLFLITELNKLKLSKISWEDVIRVVESQTAVTSVDPKEQKVIKSKKAEYIKFLKIPNRVCYSKKEIEQYAAVLTEKYKTYLENEDFEEIRLTLSNQLKEIEEAKIYLAENSLCTIQNPENEELTSNDKKSINELKNQIYGLLIVSDNLTKEELIDGIKKILKKQ